MERINNKKIHYFIEHLLVFLHTMWFQYSLTSTTSTRRWYGAFHDSEQLDQVGSRHTCVATHIITCHGPHSKIFRAVVVLSSVWWDVTLCSLVNMFLCGHRSVKFFWTLFILQGHCPTGSSLPPISDIWTPLCCVAYSFTLKEAADSPWTSIYLTAWCHNPGYHNRTPHLTQSAYCYHNLHKIICPA
jgi:hypothetical protein